MYPKLHHGRDINVVAHRDLIAGWADAWHSIGVMVIGWGWLQSSLPGLEAQLAVDMCRMFDLDGYIANAEDPYEGAGRWKSSLFVKRFRELAPRAPLALSYIGDGYPYRDLDFESWIDAGAALMPQCYWANCATSIEPSLWAIDRLKAPHSIVIPTLGSSGFEYRYPAEFYAVELETQKLTGFNVWLLESTTDDYLRTFTGLPA